MTTLLDQIQAAMAAYPQGIPRASLPERVVGQADPDLQGAIETLLLLKGGYSLEGDRWIGDTTSTGGRVMEMLDRYVATKGAAVFRLSEALKDLDPSEQLTIDQMQKLLAREHSRFRLLPNGMVRYTKD